MLVIRFILLIYISVFAILVGLALELKIRFE